MAGYFNSTNTVLVKAYENLWPVIYIGEHKCEVYNCVLHTIIPQLFATIAIHSYI